MKDMLRRLRLRVEMCVCVPFYENRLTYKWAMNLLTK